MVNISDTDAPEYPNATYPCLAAAADRRLVIASPYDDLESSYYYPGEVTDYQRVFGGIDANVADLANPAAPVFGFSFQAADIPVKVDSEGMTAQVVETNGVIEIKNLDLDNNLVTLNSVPALGNVDKVEAAGVLALFKDSLNPRIFTRHRRSTARTASPPKAP